MKGHITAKGLLADVSKDLDKLKNDLIMGFCEDLDESRYISNLLVSLANTTLEAFEAESAKGFDTENRAFQKILLLNMVLVGGMTMQTWLAKKAVEYEEMKDGE